ncbi:hypothetical protein V5S96_06425 [Corynebacterium mastitidis]|uniref:Uncharacterized protein n=1 Tax=Corynebacterium mastitidis TaxID=161890 RepID=A0ABU8P0U3_9CORY
MLDYSLRPLLSYLRATIMPTGVFAATEDFGGSGSGALTTRIAKAGGELAQAITGSAPSAPAKEESFLGLLDQHTGG